MAENERERDLVLKPNEFAYVLDRTKGLISCVVGPYKMSLSASDETVIFNEKTKRFEEASFSNAIQTFVSAPENWYVELKNPADRHPAAGTANALPDLQIGKKVNISGNVSFALYPGQMAKVIRGHRLHSNQYLLARVYDAQALADEVVDESWKEDGGITPSDSDIEIASEYTVGQLLVIKGTEVPFYIPPTGIEVIPVGGKGGEYVREAVTLERLEYCILKDEGGNKKYVHGPAVVFPEPDQVFLPNPEDNSYRFKAIELSEISGIYLKVIADYQDDKGMHIAGEELFITGKDQMIYYPRAEHAIIKYDGKLLHHAIAIPRGEGRYVLERKTGNVKMITGPAMYLPDPREEVIVRRKLSPRQCALWYPGNAEVLQYNTSLSDKPDLTEKERTRLTKSAIKFTASVPDAVDRDFADLFGASAPVATESGGISRSNTYTKPRTVMLDNPYDGVVKIDVWTGYAINVISKDGTRKVVVGPCTYLLGYDETLEVMSLSTGKPKTTDHLMETVFLRVDNNKISDIVGVQTKDFVDLDIKVSYNVDFIPNYSDRWFKCDNYVKHLTDRIRSLLKRAVKDYNIEEFHNKSADIVRNVVLDIDPEIDYAAQPSVDGVSGPGRFFEENGMLIHDVDVLSIKIQDERVEEIIDDHQIGIVKKSLELTNANKEIEVAKELAVVEKTKQDLEYAKRMYRLEIDSKINQESLSKDETLKRLNEAAQLAARKAEEELQPLLDSIQESELERKRQSEEQDLEFEERRNQIEASRNESYSENMKSVIEAISPDLVAAMTSSSNASMIESIAKSMSPISIARGESVADTVNVLLRGTSIEKVISRLTENLEESKKYVE